MQKKYQIFVSSTFRDLAEERQDAIRSILDLGHIPAGMELFPASDTEQLSYIKKVIDECDYYILIMGGRYGSLDAEGVSFTEREYDYAVETEKVVLAFVHGDAAAIPVRKSDTAPRLVQSLDEFRQKVMNGRLVREWKTRENLESLVVKAIVRAIADYPAVGWIRGNTAATEDILTQLNELRVENERLTTDNERLRRASTPRLEGLAELDESTTVRYSYTSHSRYGGTTVESQVVMSWAEIFKAAGPALGAPGSLATLKAAVSKHMKENRDISVSPSIFDADAHLIKNQLIALGFVRAYTANAVNGGVKEYMQLTDRGQAKLTELMAVRSSKPAA